MQCGGVFVERFELMHHRTKIGYVDVKRQGMYYEINCFITFQGKGRYRVILYIDGRFTDLGVGCWCQHNQSLKKRVPIKRVGEGRLTFYAVEEPNGERFVPISNGVPFSQIIHLDHCRFIRQQEITGLLCSAKGSIPQQ